MSKHRNCNVCKQPIVLVPSAAERAEKYGNTAKHYLDLFKTCSSCQIKMRAWSIDKVVQ